MRKRVLSVPILLFGLTGCAVYVTPPPVVENKQVIPSADGVTPPVKQPAITEVEVKKNPVKPEPVATKPVTAPTVKKPLFAFYVVQPGDTVFEVMRKTGAIWTDIIRLNNLKAPKYLIYPEQKLRLR